MEINMTENLKKNSPIKGYERHLPKPKVIVNVINITSDCKADPSLIPKEILLQAASFRQSVDNDNDSPLPPMLNLVIKAHNWNYQSTHAEAFPKDCIDDADYEDENNLFAIQLRRAIDSLKSQGTSHQIIFESLLQAAFDYCVRMSDNSNTLTSRLLNAVNDAFEMMVYFELDRDELEV